MKVRIDILLVKRNLVESRAKARWLIKKGYVLVNNRHISKPGKKIDNTLEIELLEDFPYVGRGGLKLEAALTDFSISVEGKICADIGASIGGFTDCLLKHGALRVYVIDTATELLHQSLITEQKRGKIIPMLGVDARNLIFIEEKLDMCAIDVTFASITQILPNIKSLLKRNGDIIALIKPIFEIDFHSKKKFRNIKNENQLFKILEDLIHWCTNHEFHLQNIIRSPLLGKERSIEFLIHLRVDKPCKEIDYFMRIREILSKVY
ncbi:MAG: TlyA family RNA methyltransferase [Candidatus Hermodarchaeota archaeon]